MMVRKVWRECGTVYMIPLNVACSELVAEERFETNRQAEIVLSTGLDVLTYFATYTLTEQDFDA